MSTAEGFFTDLENDKPYLKIAFQGFAGSGKTFTMVMLAIGLHQRIKSTKPIVYFDTEKAGKFLKPIFAAAGIKVLHKSSRSLADLKEAMRLMREGASDVLLVDSISHVWESYLESYKKSVRRTRLEFQDWGVIKPTWKAEFSDPLVRDPYHFFFTGRAGFEYENEVNEDTNKREIFKSGVKMKVEGETAYEPDLLVLMERHEDVLGHEKTVWREATIIKDRSTLIDGKTFRNPTVADFMPAIDRVLLDPSTTMAAAERDTAALFKTEDEGLERRRQRAIILEEIEGLMTKTWPGQTAEMKRAKIEALEAAFRSRSWVLVQGLRFGELEAGLAALEKHVAEKIAVADSAA